jgi:hypothetical protein
MRNTILISSHIYLKVMSGITDREIDYVNLLPPLSLPGFRDSRKEEGELYRAFLTCGSGRWLSKKI